ncbi:MAG: CoA transferase [Alphaproteobacteria bacterium]|nr:CoA transferase [Alphaproteobacteria bacterium]
MGPLAGVKVIELEGIGPAPFCAMLLSDLGAEVIRVDRREPSGLGIPRQPKYELLNRGRRSVAVDLKHRDGVETVLKLVERADALIEGFRPGVTERLGLGPEECRQRNPRLVYGRMTGWGQEGPLAHAAGHDINYIALAGALEPIGLEGTRPVPPLNLVGDFGGGAMFLAVGVLAALIEAKRSGQGQVVDAAMVDGAAYLATIFHGLSASGLWREGRGTNVLDSGAPYYDTYECADGKYVAIGSIEPKFYAELLKLTGLAGETLPKQNDLRAWKELKARFAAVFKTKSREEWCRIMEGSDVCFAPVLSLTEAPKHPHMAARGSFVEVAGVTQPGPAPRFSRTPGKISKPPSPRGADTDAVLADWGFAAAEIARLRGLGAIG